MKSIKYNGATILKLIINHCVSSIYSLMLLLIFYAISDGKYLLIGGILSVFFYLWLIYSFMWNAGANDSNSYYHGELKSTGGFWVITVATLVSIITNLVATVLSFFVSGIEGSERTIDFVYSVFYFINSLFTQCMYTGIFASLNGNVLKDLPAWWYLISIIPAIIVGGASYSFGFKSFRLRTLFGIKYDVEKEKTKNNY